MDGSQFDALTRRLTSIRLTRGEALCGMAAGALTLAGMAQLADEASAGKRRKVCHCPESETCATERVGRRKRKTHLREHQCDYLGACRSDITACAAAPIIVNVDRLGTACSATNPCGNNSGLDCVAGFCVPRDLGETCTNNGECSTGRCEEGVCVLCPTLSTCAGETGPQCCTGLAICDPETNVCVLT